MKLSIHMVLVLLFSACALGKEIGTVMIVRGEAELLHNKIKTKLKIGKPISDGDEIQTKVGAYVKVVMQDRNIIVLAENSSLSFDEYITHKASKKVKMTLAYGSARHVVNQKYTGEKEKYEVRTPTTVAGVRGTDFLTIYNKESFDSVTCTLDGKVELKIGDQPFLIEGGNFAKVRSGDVSVQVVQTDRQWLEKVLRLHTLE